MPFFSRQKISLWCIERRLLHYRLIGLPANIGNILTPCLKCRQAAPTAYYRAATTYSGTARTALELNVSQAANKGQKALCLRHKWYASLLLDSCLISYPVSFVLYPYFWPAYIGFDNTAWEQLQQLLDNNLYGKGGHCPILLHIRSTGEFIGLEFIRCL